MTPARRSGWRWKPGAPRWSAIRCRSRRSWRWRRTASACPASPRRSVPSREPAWYCGHSSRNRLLGAVRCLAGPWRLCRPGRPGRTAVRVSVTGQGLLDRVEDVEDLAQPRDPENPQNAALGADEVDPAVVRAHPLESPDQHAQPGRVKELDPLHVHDQVVLFLIDEPDEHFPQARRRVNVYLPVHRDDGPARSSGILIEHEVHGLSPLLLSGTIVGCVTILLRTRTGPRITARRTSPTWATMSSRSTPRWPDTRESPPGT